MLALRPHFRLSKGLLLPSLVGLIIVPVLLVIIALEIRHEFDRGRQLRIAVNQTYEARLQMQTVLSLMQDAETGQRGYVITGQRNFLEPYDKALQRLEQERRRLHALLVADLGSAGRPADELSRLDDLIDAKLVNMRETVLVRGTGIEGAAEARIASGEGKRIMDGIRANIERMSQAQSQALAERIAVDARRTKETEKATLAVFLSLGALLAGAFGLILRQAGTRQRLLEQVQANAARTSGIFESAQDGLITFNRSGTIETINRAGRVMFGVGDEDLRGREAGALFDLPDNGKLFLERLVGPAGLGDGVTRELVGRRSDGTSFPAEVSLGAFKLADGMHIVAAMRDISDRRRVERLKAEFVSTVSHELRTPLTSIAGSLGLLAGGAAGPLPERAARLISIGHANCQRLVRLINDILDVEKIESGAMTFQMNVIDLGAVAESAIEAMQGLAGETGVKFIYRPTAGSFKVRGDPDRLAQVAANLLSNAAKFSPRGASVEVTVEACPNSAVRLSVQDTGSGVPADFHERIFSKFAQADGSDTRKLGGTGLGLAISREIVERHGGRIWFDSPPGQGATFHVELPPLTAAHRPASSAGLVLICEDDPDAADILASLTAELGLASEIVGSMAAAKAALASGRYFSALLLDLRLPDGHGLELLQILRAEPKTANLPVLIIAGEAGCIPQGLAVLDWLQKPVDVRRLHAALETICVDPAAGRPVVLHVEDDPDVRHIVADALGAYCDLVAVDSLEGARERLKTTWPRLAILDIALASGSGLDLLPDLQRKGRDKVSIIVFSAQDVDDAEILSSVDAVLTKSYTSLEELSSMVRHLVQPRLVETKN